MDLEAKVQVGTTLQGLQRNLTSLERQRGEWIDSCRRTTLPGRITPVGWHNGPNQESQGSAAIEKPSTTLPALPSASPKHIPTKAETAQAELIKVYHSLSSPKFSADHITPDAVLRQGRLGQHPSHLCTQRKLDRHAHRSIRVLRLPHQSPRRPRSAPQPRG